MVYELLHCLAKAEKRVRLPLPAHFFALVDTRAMKCKPIFRLVHAKNSETKKCHPKLRGWKIVWYCAFPTKKQAIDLELYLKTASGIAFKRKRLLQEHSRRGLYM